MNPSVIILVIVLALCRAAVLPLEEEEFSSFDLHRQKRGDPPQLYGGGGANSQVQSGTIGLQYPTGSGGKLSYGHAKGYGHDFSVDAMVPIWSKQHRFGDSTLNVGGGVTQHFGGYSGTHMADKRIGLNFVHRF